MSQVLKLGIPKGSLEAATLELFAQAGWRIRTRSRNYFPTVNDEELSPAPWFVHRKWGSTLPTARWISGLTGQDWLLETGADVVTVSDLVYSKASDQPCRWVLVVKNDSPIQSVKDLEGKIVSTELVEFTRRYLAMSMVSPPRSSFRGARPKPRSLRASLMPRWRSRRPAAPFALTVFESSATC